MLQAITTKYLGPTNHRGSRIVARAYARRITVAWDHALDVEENHTRAAMTLVLELGWGPANHWVGGSLPDGTGYAFCRLPRGDRRLPPETE